MRLYVIKELYTGTYYTGGCYYNFDKDLRCAKAYDTKREAQRTVKICSGSTMTTSKFSLKLEAAWQILRQYSKLDPRIEEYTQEQMQEAYDKVQLKVVEIRLEEVK